MQRGHTITAAMTIDFEKRPTDTSPILHAKTWLAQPFIVRGTSAVAIEPAIASGQPRATNFKNLDLLAQDAAKVTRISISKMMDNESGCPLWAKHLVARVRDPSQPRNSERPARHRHMLQPQPQ